MSIVRLTKLFVLAAVIIASFSGGLVYRSGGVESLLGQQKKVVGAGHFSFSYPAKWREMPHAALPAKAMSSLGAGQVVGGVCPAPIVGAPKSKAAKAPACAPGANVVYMLFQEGQVFPGPKAMERIFDGHFPRSFRGFRKVSSQLAVTADGTRYLRYEFSFRQGARRRHEIVAAYRSEGAGVIAIATGPAATFTAHRESIVQIMDGAHETG